MIKNEAVSGDAIEVRVALLGGEVKTLTLSEGATVSDALDRVDIDMTGKQFYVDGEKADMQDELENGDVLSVVTENTKGGKI